MIHNVVEKKGAANEITPENGRQLATRSIGTGLVAVGAGWSVLQFFAIENWWASFIYLGAALFFSAAWRFRQEGHSLPTRVTVGIGTIVATVATLFLFNFDWEVWWPAMLIVPGAVLWFNGRLRPQPKENPALHSLAIFTSWIGTTVFLLGLTFLAHTCQWIDLGYLFGDIGWWGAFLLLPGVGIWRSITRNRHDYNPALLLIWNSVSAILIVEGILHLLSLYDWSLNRLMSFIFITAGLIVISYRWHLD